MKKLLLMLFLWVGANAQTVVKITDNYCLVDTKLKQNTVIIKRANAVIASAQVVKYHNGYTLLKILSTTQDFQVRVGDTIKRNPLDVGFGYTCNLPEQYAGIQLMVISDKGGLYGAYRHGKTREDNESIMFSYSVEAGFILPVIKPLNVYAGAVFTERQIYHYDFGSNILIFYWADELESRFGFSAGLIIDYSPLKINVGFTSFPRGVILGISF